MSERQIFTLQQVAKSIRKTIEERYHSTYWVKAEMHKLNRFPSGHAFPELVQKDGQKIVAQLTGTIWRAQLENINRRFVEVVKEPLKEGTQLLLLVKIVFSENYGLSLHVLDIDPSFSLGELQRQREETLKKLAKNGLLNKNQQLNFPLLPKRIAIISAEASKGLSDFMQVLDDVKDRYTFFTMLFPAYLQGDVAVESIQQALLKIKKVQAHFDVVVIVRGGGAEVGMTCYNHYDLCAAIADFPLPILTGIGHSTNLNVAEMVAFHNAITPSKLATLLIESFEEFERETSQYSQIISQIARQILEKQQTAIQFSSSLLLQSGKSNVRFYRQTLEATRKNLIMQSMLFQQDEQRNLEQKSLEVTRLSQELLQKNLREVDHYFGAMVQGVKTVVQKQRMFLDQGRREMNIFVKNQVSKEQKELANLEAKTNMLHPENVLKRGYAIVRFNGENVTGNHIPILGASLEIETIDLKILAKTQEVESKSATQA
jgi:exodeoxyribonuclease VII large subunit